MLNSLVPAAVFTRLSDAHERVFESVAPDFCLCFRILQQEPFILYVDEALTVMHGLDRSNGNSTSRGVASADAVDFLDKARAGRGIAAETALPKVTTTYNVIVQEYVAAGRAGGHAMPPLDQRAYLRTLARETEAFVPGPMKEANMREFESAGMAFAPRDRLGRRVADVRHLLRVLGPRDFLVLTADRLSTARAETFATVDEALAAAVRGRPRRRSSPRRLHYLAGSASD